jgi:hypothetical protein
METTKLSIIAALLLSLASAASAEAPGDILFDRAHWVKHGPVSIWTAYGPATGFAATCDGYHWEGYFSFPNGRMYDGFGYSYPGGLIQWTSWY